MDRYKGKKGYISLLKRYDMIFILISAIIAVGVFLTGLNIWKTKANIATVVSVLSLLPACKRLTNLIIILPFKGIKDENFEKISPKLKDGWFVLCDMLFSTEKYMLKFEHMVMAGNKMFIFSEMTKDKNNYSREYLENAFKKRAIDVTVNLYDKINDYTAVLGRCESDGFDNEKARDYVTSLLV